MRWIFAAFVLCATANVVQSAASTVAWCYNDPSCNDATWPILAPKFCSGTRQSPINIVSASAKSDNRLIPFTFNNFNSKSALTKIENTGRTVKVRLAHGVGVSGGGLSKAYDSLQFHLHWGNTASVPGSEHTVDGKRYPMELHIVNIKASHKRNTAKAVADSKGLAALGFFIDVKNGSETNQPAAWHTLTNYLSSIQKSGTSVRMSPGISLDDLLVGVDRTKYYRYLGSLTTPNCQEAVVWTVFKEPIKVSRDLIDRFSTTVYVTKSSSTFMTNVYRHLQPYQPVTTQKKAGTKGHYSGLENLLHKLDHKKKENNNS